MQLSLEQLELAAAANERQRARELLDLLVVTNRAFGGDKDSWRELQRGLIERTKAKE